jgi:hypothetical protein
METVKEIDYKGYTIRMHPDNDPENPRTTWDNAAHMICFHRRYILGDKHDFSHPEDFQQFMKENPSLIVLPLFLYDHSGITMSTGSFSCPWDSGQVGWIYMTAKEAAENWCKKICTKTVREKATKCMKQEVETYDDYITGSVYGYSILAPPEDENEEDEGEGEEIDSCLGYYGYDEKKSGLLEAAQYSIDYHIKAEEKRKAEEAVKALLLHAEQMAGLELTEVY